MHVSRQRQSVGGRCRRGCVSQSESDEIGRVHRRHPTGFGLGNHFVAECSRAIIHHWKAHRRVGVIVVSDLVGGVHPEWCCIRPIACDPYSCWYSVCVRFSLASSRSERTLRRKVASRCAESNARVARRPAARAAVPRVDMGTRGRAQRDEKPAPDGRLDVGSRQTESEVKDRLWGNSRNRRGPRPQRAAVRTRATRRRAPLPNAKAKRPKIYS